jgi:hypothetical protein
MQQCLALSAAAIEIAGFTVLFQLCHVPPNGAPTANLPYVILAATAGIISAIPLEPTARIVRMDPPFASPFR